MRPTAVAAAPKNQVDPSADTEIRQRLSYIGFQLPPKTKSIHQRILKYDGGWAEWHDGHPKNQVDPSADTEISL